MSADWGVGGSILSSVTPKCDHLTKFPWSESESTGARMWRDQPDRDFLQSSAICGLLADIGAVVSVLDAGRLCETTLDFGKDRLRIRRQAPASPPCSQRRIFCAVSVLQSTSGPLRCTMIPDSLQDTEQRAPAVSSQGNNDHDSQNRPVEAEDPGAERSTWMCGLAAQGWKPRAGC